MSGNEAAPVSNHLAVLMSLKEPFLMLTRRVFSWRRRFYLVVHARPRQNPDRYLAWALDFIIFVTVCISTITYIAETDSRFYNPLGPQGIILNAETFCAVVLTIDILLRFAAAWSIEDIFNLQSLVDTLSVVGFYITFLLERFNLTPQASDVEMLRLLRMARIFRMLRLFLRTDYGQGLKIIGRTLLIETHQGLVMLLLLLVTMLFTLATLFYNVEKSANTWDPYTNQWIEPSGKISPFQSIPESLWFSCVTMAKVGYGDVVPASQRGRAVAVLMMFCGVIFLSMPAMVVSATFEQLHSMTFKRASNRKLGKKFRKVLCCVRFIRLWREYSRTGRLRLGNEQQASPSPARNNLQLQPFDPIFFVSGSAASLEGSTQKALSTHVRGLATNEVLNCVVFAFSGCCTTREIMTWLRTHRPREGGDPQRRKVRRRDVAATVLHLAAAQLFQAFIISLDEDDVLVAASSKALEAVALDQQNGHRSRPRCYRCLADAQHIWEATTGSVEPLQALAKSAFSSSSSEVVSEWVEAQRSVPPHGEGFAYNHNTEKWKSNTVIGEEGRYVCLACVHCAPSLESCQGDATVLRQYLVFLEAQKALITRRRQELESRRKQLALERQHQQHPVAL